MRKKSLVDAIIQWDKGMDLSKGPEVLHQVREILMQVNGAPDLATAKNMAVSAIAIISQSLRESNAPSNPLQQQ